MPAATGDTTVIVLACRSVTTSWHEIGREVAALIHSSGLTGTTGESDDNVTAIFRSMSDESGHNQVCSTGDKFSTYLLSR